MVHRASAGRQLNLAVEDLSTRNGSSGLIRSRPWAGVQHSWLATAVFDLCFVIQVMFVRRDDSGFEKCRSDAFPCLVTAEVGSMDAGRAQRGARTTSETSETGETSEPRERWGEAMTLARASAADQTSRSFGSERIAAQSGCGEQGCRRGAGREHERAGGDEANESLGRGGRYR